MAQDRIELDVGQATTPQRLHEFLASTLGFPDYYGKNWDAFWDCIRDPEQSVLPNELILKGMAQLEKRMPREATIFRKCLIDLKAEKPEIRIIFEPSADAPL